MFIFLYFISLAAHAAELPELKVPKDWLKCEVVADCVVAGDACRSCGKLFIINKRFTKDFLMLDDRLRKNANFMPACEACSSARVALSCRNNICEQDGKKPKIYPVMNCKDWRPNWDGCKADTDCTVISNPCGWPTSSANKLFSEAASQCNRIEGAALSCASWNELDNGKRISKCDAGKCTNQEKTD